MKKNSVATAQAENNSVKKQTENAWKTMMKKTTREKYDMRWSGLGRDYYLDSSDIKTLTAMAEKAGAGEVVSTDFDADFNTEFGCVNAKVIYAAKRQGMKAYIEVAVKVGDNIVYRSEGLCYAKFNSTKSSIDYDMLMFLNESLEEAVTKNIMYAEREVTLRMRRNEDGGWDLIVPQGLNIKEVRYE